jgi:hypothetical protein
MTYKLALIIHYQMCLYVHVYRPTGTAIGT